MRHRGRGRVALFQYPGDSGVQPARDWRRNASPDGLRDEIVREALAQEHLRGLQLGPRVREIEHFAAEDLRGERGVELGLGDGADARQLGRERCQSLQPRLDESADACR